MEPSEDFKIKFRLFEKYFKQTLGACYINGGRDKYLVTDVDENRGVTIKQGKTFQKHKLDHLRSLYTKGFFYGPRNNVRYDRDYRKGHLLMKNAICFSKYKKDK